MTKKKESYSDNLQASIDIFKTLLDRVNEKIADPNYRWNPNDHHSELQETVVQLEVLKMVVDNRHNTNVSDEEYYDLILLFRNSYKAKRQIDEELGRSRHTDRNLEDLAKAYMQFKMNAPHLLEVFLTKENVEKCEKLTKKLQSKYEKRQQGIPLLFI